MACIDCNYRDLRIRLLQREVERLAKTIDQNIKSAGQLAQELNQYREHADYRILRMTDTTKVN